MTKKRGPNSPMESEKSKLSTSAATKTLGMAAMLSVVNTVSHAFGQGQANSIVTDSEDDDDLSQTDEQIINEGASSSGNGNPWHEENLSQSKVRSPERSNPRKKPEPLFEHFYSDGANRDEIEIEINTKNGKKFTGSITPLEVKHGIYISKLGFPDHTNFDGVRIGFKGKLVVTIKLIKPIDVDELCAVEYFDYVRISTYRGKQIEEVIGCKIRGLRRKQPTASAFDHEPQDETKTLVKIEGCEHRIPKDQILTLLSFYGSVESELEEDCFVDTIETGASNRTGNYSVMMNLEYKIPQLIPMAGRRIKIYHKGIDKLCSKCFGKHRKSDCKANTKTEWIEYVANFIDSNPDVPTEMYGRWVELVEKNKAGLLGKQKNDNRPQLKQRDDHEVSNTNEHIRDTTNAQPEPQTAYEKSAVEPRANQIVEHPTQAPSEEEFELPTNEEQYESMVDRFATIGLKRSDLDKVLESRRTAFNKAQREFKVAERKKKAEEAKSTKKPRKNSLVK